MTRTPADYRWPRAPEWCPGCGHFGVLQAVYNAFAELDLDPARVVLVSGIGCSSRLPHYVRATSVHTIHGRAIPYALGIKLANPALEVIVVGGDGDLVAIGGNHLLHLGRRNVDMAVILMDNSVYGLTRGQAGPTLAAGVKLKAVPKANPQSGVNPLLLAIASGFTFVARGYAFDVRHTSRLIAEAIKHRGSAFLQILSPCVTYNNVMTRDWYEERIYKLDEDPSWDPVVRREEEAGEKIRRALDKIVEVDKIPLGVFYKNELVPTFEERYEATYDPTYRANPPALQRVESGGRTVVDFEKLVADRLL
ncbi:2-oxoacid:ferredoxin oxidoreductase subunit beta [Pyrobaculum neutrophilum]|uniref:2-oxoacid oxidoreductase (ferredoxin) n=1 Tax=Pyrobaculum neutrophilum (strain DSM 2338 / JCM 9278 / NBRC 100436 / V24Sta) TaxID=444157 RepID=B1YAB3_PYRNV|nr:2-oxoacid:ferredoxin oxidoreductase subunit beta [Pyrobaculum neutrophilum]ACB39087.1 pyruvate ferredoxin/flavodoxin oxidoreductase, beta subunit [Pyrobaculum neutrophilum V24Sta]